MKVLIKYYNSFRKTNFYLRLTIGALFAFFIAERLLFLDNIWQFFSSKYEAHFTVPEVEHSVLKFPLRLGDNYRSNYGGDLLLASEPSNCYRGMPLKNFYVWCIDKKDENIFPINGTGRYGYEIVREIIIPDFKSVNLGAWQHIYSGPISDMSEEEVSRGVFFDGSQKIWRLDKGNYYKAVAPFLVGFQLPIANMLRRSPDIENIYGDYDIEVQFEALTGGCREDQPSKLFIFFEGLVRNIEFPTCNSKDTRVIEEEFDFTLKKKVRAVAELGLFVLAWQEEYPIPPETYDGDRSGPAHLQDIDINWISTTIRQAE